MKKDVMIYIRSCADCQLRKLVRTKTKNPLIITDTAPHPFDKVSMDIVGPLPQTRRGNQYILTIQDHLTKYSLAIPLKKLNAPHVADAFVKKFICYFGSPKAFNRSEK